MRHSFLQWAGTLSRHLLAEKDDLGCAEDALSGVYMDPVPLEPIKESPEVLLVLLGGSGENEDIVQVCEAEVESPQHLVHEPLERLRGVAQAEGHEEKLEKAEVSGYGGLRDIKGMHGNLDICSHQVDFGIEPATR
jgi:hypothetical protein